MPRELVEEMVNNIGGEDFHPHLLRQLPCLRCNLPIVVVAVVVVAVAAAASSAAVVIAGEFH